MLRLRRILAKIIPLISWNEGVPETEFQEFIQNKQQALLFQNFLNWHEQMQSVFSDFQRIDKKTYNGVFIGRKNTFL